MGFFTNNHRRLGAVALVTVSAFVPLLAGGVAYAKDGHGVESEWHGQGHAVLSTPLGNGSVQWNNSVNSQGDVSGNWPPMLQIPSLPIVGGPVKGNSAGTLKGDGHFHGDVRTSDEDGLPPGLFNLAGIAQGKDWANAPQATRQQLRTSLNKLHADQKTEHTARQALMAAVHRFIQAMEQALAQNNGQAVQIGTNGMTPIITTLHTALQSQQEANQAAHIEQQAKKMEQALTAIDKVDSMVTSKTTAMETATLSLQSLTQEIQTMLTATESTSGTAVSNGTSDSNSAAATNQTTVNGATQGAVSSTSNSAGNVTVQVLNTTN